MLILSADLNYLGEALTIIPAVAHKVLKIAVKLKGKVVSLILLSLLKLSSELIILNNKQLKCLVRLLI